MIDFHLHLDLYPEPRAVIDQCEAHGIDVLSVTTTPSAWIGTSALAQGKRRVCTALGLHPQIAQERISELGLFDQLLPQAQFVGEVGLDGAPEFKPHLSAQLQVFTHVLRACAAAGGRVLSIHSRRAASQVLDQVESEPRCGTPVLHWFSGSKSELARAVALGCWFSVGPSMLRTGRGRSLVALMPRERILTESDGPFAQMDGRAAQPKDVVLALEAVSSIWSVPAVEVAATIEGNLRRLTLAAGLGASKSVWGSGR